MKYSKHLPRLVYLASECVGRIMRRIRESYIQYKCVGYCEVSKVRFIPSKMRFHGMPYLRFDNHCTVEIIGDFLCNSGVGGGTIDNHSYSQIHVYPNAKLYIGDIFGMSNSCIICTDSITIGNHVCLGAGSMIVDSDFHSLRWEDMRDGSDMENAKHAPVTIKDYAFIGANAIIMKGVTIGEKARVGAGSVVTKNVPDGEIWAGNPAKRIGVISQ